MVLTCFSRTVLARGERVARRSSSGIVAAWAEAQRRQQRQREAQERAWRSAQLEQERAQRAVLRAHAHDQREAWRAYQHGRELDAAARTNLLEGQVAELSALLRNVLAAPRFRIEQLLRDVVVPPFNPGPLGAPVAMPDRRAYEVVSPSGLRALSPAARRQHQETSARARAQFESDWHGATQAEERRRRQLDDYYRQYQLWAEKERQNLIDYNLQVEEIGQQVVLGNSSAIKEFFTAAIYGSAGWPDSLPRKARVAWDQAECHLIVDWQLPDYGVVPETSRYRYIKSDDRETRIARPAGERKALYRQILAQSGLAILAEVFGADRHRIVKSASINGFVDRADPATGRQAEVFLLTAMVERQAFTRLDISNVDPVSCLEGLRGHLSRRPENMERVHPIHLAAAAGVEPSSARPANTDMMKMDPIEFENLVADLFQAMGWQVMTTERTGDGGVDVRAMNLDPVQGGKLVIQVKRYKSSIPPAPVRDLYGTMLHEGATRGIFVTSSEFGPSALEFASGKPLTLIGGRQLADLLTRYGFNQSADESHAAAQPST
jgi:restriction system protein